MNSMTTRRWGMTAILLLIAASAAGLAAQTRPIDDLAGKKFGMPIISRGDNIPDFEPMKDRMDLLVIALHKGIPATDFGAKMGVGPAKVEELLRFLEGKNYVHRVGGRIKPSVFIADAEDGARLYEWALPVSRRIVEAIRASLPSLRERFSGLDMSRGRRFEDWSFFILGDVLLDNWQIRSVERDFLKAADRPLRHGKNYYAAFLEKNPKNEPFGIYGNMVGTISVFGNNRGRAEASATNNKVSAADNGALEAMAADFLPRLLEVLESTRPYAEKVFADSGYSKEAAFNEFYLWWYHFIYTQAINLMAEAGMLTLPADGNFFYQMM